MGNAESGAGGGNLANSNNNNNRRISVDFRASGSAINSPNASGKVPRNRTPSMNVASFVQNLPTDMIKTTDGNINNSSGNNANGKFTTAVVSSQGVTIEESGPKTGQTKEISGSKTTTKTKAGTKAPPAISTTTATAATPGVMSPNGGSMSKTPKAPKLIDIHQNVNFNTNSNSNNSSNSNTARVPETTPLATPTSTQQNKTLQPVTEEQAPSPLPTATALNDQGRTSNNNNADGESGIVEDGELHVPASSAMAYRGGGGGVVASTDLEVDRRSLTHLAGDAKTKNAEYAKKLREAEKLKKEGEFASLEEEERKRRLENLEEQQQHEQQKSHHLNKMNSTFKTGNGLQRPQSVRRVSNNNTVNSSTGNNNNGNAIKVAVGAVS